MHVERSTRGMYERGYKACVVWDDGSKSYYRNKKEAISAIRSDIAKNR